MMRKIMMSEDKITMPFMDWCNVKAFENVKSEWEKRKLEQRMHAKKVFGLLEFPENIDKIEVNYDGSDDSGAIEGIEYYDYNDDKIEIKDDGELKEAVENYAYTYLESSYGGWEINDGSYGIITIDLKNKKASINHHQREMTESIETDEIAL